MYLKEVHMENFKSFGRKLTVPFAKGFTAITGPNGSGKSNIGDAILFVLGPRSSRAIRAGKLSELIFNGGKDGTPAKECLVSLVFDNSDRLMPLDADEVTLTRRVKRAPKPDDPDAYYSYFYINGRASALKEFADLLDHARISADGYNIVTQGSVLNLVQMSPVERRRVIEQMAGIAEFDKDIEKAEKQKAEVHANLERIGIVLDEIDRNLKQLKRDRDGALRYKELSEELGVKKGQRALALKLDVEARIARTHERIRKLEEDRRDAVERVNRLREEERERTRDLIACENEIAETGGEELREVQEQIKALRHERSTAEANANHAMDEIEEIGRELEDVRSDLKRIEKEHHDALHAAETHEEHANVVRATAERLDKELTDYRESIAQSDSDAMDVHRKLAELKKEFERTSATRHEKTLEADRLRDRLAAAQRAVDDATDSERVAKTDIDEIDLLLEDLKERADPEAVKAHEKALFEKKKRQAAITEELQDLERTANRTRTKLAELRAQKAAAEGVQHAYSRAVDAILTARDSGDLQGICGTIAELGQVDGKFATAIETAAGGRTQCIVVETAKDAQDAIEHLRKNRLGRATFLPLDKMTASMPRGKSLMVVNDPASHGFAIDLIKFNKRYERAFQYVFGDTVVVGKLDDARRLMGGVRLVTMQGDLIEASGAMTGGDAGKGKAGVGFGGVDASEIERLGSELRAAETHIETLSDEITALRTEILTLEDQLREAKGSTESMEAKRQALEKQRAELAKRLEQAQSDRVKRAEEADRLEDQLQTTETKVGQLNDTLADMDAKRETLGRALLATTKKELADRIRKLEADLLEAKDATREAEKKRDVAQGTAKLVKERVEELRARVEKLAKEQAEYKEEKERLNADMERLDTAIDALEDQTREASAAMADLHEKRDGIKDRLSELKSQVEKWANQAEVGYGLIAKEKDGLPALEEQLAEALVELKETQYTHPDDAALPPLDEVKRDIRRLESDIQALGPINQRALEEYDHQAERKQELEDKVLHLNEERETLERLVAEIVTKKTADFMEVFDAINENFKRVYSQLSLNGSAYLALEEPNDPFAGGLTMMARPKGKRVTRIDALSGGEKSITALAFIFAIQAYEPSPFYYLDEVDQNLDGVNSDMIGRMVAENSRKAQFIMVSLRKVTLRQADHIYGVTMQKVGLSEIVGNFDIHQLREDEEKERPDRPTLDSLHDDEVPVGGNGSGNGTEPAIVEEAR